MNAHFDTAKYLLEAGANVNKWDFWGRTPLYAAVDFNTCRTAAGPIGRRSTTRRASQMIDILLAAGANPNAQLKLFPPYRSLRMDRGADAILDIGTTPLLRAARGARHRRDRAARRRRRARRPAAARRHHAVDGRRRARARARSTRAASSARSSTRSRRPTRCSRRAPPSTSATRAAARRCTTRPPSGYTDVAKLLVEHGADLAATDADGVTPIDAANGKLRSSGGGGRGAGATYPATVAALEELLAVAQLVID